LGKLADSGQMIRLATAQGIAAAGFATISGKIGLEPGFV
jgi:hypothetical protein